jgi:ketosteroid isomerase-like protein
MKRLFSFAVFLSAAACHQLASTDERMIRQSRIKSNEAIANHDTTLLASFWTDDICVITSRNVKNLGRPQNAKAFASEFKLKEGVNYIRTTTQVEIFEDWNMAAEHGIWVGRWKKDGSSIEMKGSYYAKWKKIKDQWLIFAETYTPLSCKGDVYCNDIP